MRRLFPALFALLLAAPVAAQDLETLRPVADQGAAERANLVQVMVDSIFSFGELGFQEFETSRYLTEVLRENAFEVEDGISGIPTAWWAKWGSGSPRTRRSPGDPPQRGADGRSPGGDAAVLHVSGAVRHRVPDRPHDGTAKAGELMRTPGSVCRESRRRRCRSCEWPVKASGLFVLVRKQRQSGAQFRFDFFVRCVEANEAFRSGRM